MGSPDTAPVPPPSILESVLKRDKYVIAAALLALTLLAWAYLVYLARGMTGMDVAAVEGMSGMAGPGMAASMGPVDLLLLFLMWAVMMVGMMAPSATPMILAFANINRRRRLSGSPYVPTGIFLTGYLLVWAGFSLAASLTQWGLESVALLTPMMASASPILGGGLLLAAGAFQLSPLKEVCLRRCRTPMSFIVNDWREGTRGALLMGLHHGGYCLGCCWALMALLFLLGVMNLLWIAALAGLVLLEKVAPGGAWIGRITGVGFLAWGLWLLGGTFL